MLLSIIVPCHLETKEDIYPLMISINEQVGINFDEFELLLCNDVDGDYPLKDEYFPELKNVNKILRHVKSPYKNNPGLSRQCGLDECKGDYAFFCDADDSLFHCLVLRNVAENIINSQSDIYIFKFMEEHGRKEDSFKVYKEKEFNFIWVFSKAYKVSSLKQKGIRFCDKLHYHEDSYLNMCCKYSGLTVQTVDTMPVYLWRYNENSITRRNEGSYLFNEQWEYIEAMKYAYRFIMKKFNIEEVDDLYRVLAMQYGWLIHPDYRDVDKEIRERIEIKFVEFIKEFIPELFEGKMTRQQTQLIKHHLNSFKDDSYLPDMTFFELIEYLKNKYKEII